MDANPLAAAGFYIINQSDIVRCVFCGVEIGYWTEEDVALKEYRRWSPYCSFAKGLHVGNNPILCISQRNHLNSLPEATTFAGLITS